MGKADMGYRLQTDDDDQRKKKRTTTTTTHGDLAALQRTARGVSLRRAFLEGWFLDFALLLRLESLLLRGANFHDAWVRCGHGAGSQLVPSQSERRQGHEP